MGNETEEFLKSAGIEIISDDDDNGGGEGNEAQQQQQNTEAQANNATTTEANTDANGAGGGTSQSTEQSTTTQNSQEATQQQTQFDEPGYLKEIIGNNVSSKEEARNFIEAKDRRIKELEQQVNGSGAATKTRESVSKYEAFVTATDIEDHGVYSRFTKTDLDKADPIDLLILQKEVSAKKAFTPQEIAEYREWYTDKYKQDDQEHDEKQIRLGKIELAEAASSAKDYLASVKEKASQAVPTSSNDVYKQNVENWKPRIAELSTKDEFRSIKFKQTLGAEELGGGEAADLEVNFNIPDADIQRYMSDIWHHVASAGTPVTEDIKDKALGVVHKRVWADHGETIAKKMVTLALEKQSERKAAEIHNPSGLNRQQNNDAGQQKDDTDLVFESIIKHHS